ncbi:hypothetical protein ANN_20596 [Periplaneta americana]|uniref:Mos1 transposase HTH domain-containing protein n=1 Tax=Periplaneta americana TaxID=6978 RepID=A0ABQ8SDF2_PERAM|nr:hypothetical protein ANN_20596 [Periplaneta americana]
MLLYFPIVRRRRKITYCGTLVHTLQGSVLVIIDAITSVAVNDDIFSFLWPSKVNVDMCSSEKINTFASAPISQHTGHCSRCHEDYFYESSRGPRRTIASSSDYGERSRCLSCGIRDLDHWSCVRLTCGHSLTLDRTTKYCALLQFQRAYGDVCMGASSVRRWVKHFEDGNKSIEDEPRSGRPRTASTERNKERTVLKLCPALREKRPGKKIILQHGNAWPHTDRITVEKIGTFGWETLPQSPYSDLKILRTIFRFCGKQTLPALEDIRKAVLRK